ncbi:hypothetical protein U1Q18_036623 [Sarracenia purpurea var. burkii]
MEEFYSVDQVIGGSRRRRFSANRSQRTLVSRVESSELILFDLLRNNGFQPIDGIEPVIRAHRGIKDGGGFDPAPAVTRCKEEEIHVSVGVEARLQRHCSAKKKIGAWIRFRRTLVSAQGRRRTGGKSRIALAAN